MVLVFFCASISKVRAPIRTHSYDINQQTLFATANLLPFSLFYFEFLSSITVGAFFVLSIVIFEFLVIVRTNFWLCFGSSRIYYCGNLHMSWEWSTWRISLDPSRLGALGWSVLGCITFVLYFFLLVLRNLSLYFYKYLQIWRSLRAHILRGKEQNWSFYILIYSRVI